MNLVYLSQRKAAKEIGSDEAQITRWFRELQHFGFIVMEQPGYLGVDGHGRAPHWRLTELPTKGKGLTPVIQATRDFDRWNGVPFSTRKKQNPVRENTDTLSVKTRTVSGKKPPIRTQTVRENTDISYNHIRTEPCEAMARLRTDDFLTYNVDPTGVGDGSPTDFMYSNGRDDEGRPAGWKQWCRTLELVGIAFQ